jgi:hypothetical protein
MDEFEKRLKRDADAIQADIPPVLRSRIDASLSGVETVRPVNRVHRSQTRLWWASSLTGLAAAIAVIGFINWNTPVPGPDIPPIVSGATVPAPVLLDLMAIPPNLNVRTADFTSPLEEELIKLQEDLEKARESVREDVSFTF